MQLKKALYNTKNADFSFGETCAQQNGTYRKD